MTVYVENETEVVFSFDEELLCRQVAEAALDSENCPYEAQVNVLITDSEESGFTIKNTGISTKKRMY